jgi:hypothetical protein
MNQTRKVYGNRFLMLSAPTTTSGQASALDLVSGQVCLVAWATRHSDEAIALATERHLFLHLATQLTVPQVLGWFNDADDELTVLVLSLIEGTPLDKVLMRDGPIRPVSGALLAQWGLSLIEWVQACQAVAPLIPPLNLHHMVVTPTDMLTFQRLQPLGAILPPEPAIVQMVGQLLYFWATTYRYDPTQRWTCRPIRATNFTVTPALAHTLQQLVEGESTLLTLADLVGTLRENAVDYEVEATTATMPIAPSALPALWEKAAFGAGDHLAATLTRPTQDLTLYRGLAGRVLVLAELMLTFPVERWRTPLRTAAIRLADPIPPQTHPGSLYLGEAGIALALIKAGDALGDDQLVEQGLRVAKQVADLPHHAPDLVWGAAGRLRFQTWLWQRTGDPQLLTAAQESAIWLRENVIAVEDHAGYFWQGPQDSKVAPYLGYGHGIAGIGDALLDLYTITQEPLLLEVVQTIAETLHTTAVPTFGGAGVNWPNYLKDGVLLDQWCHGASGVGLFWLQLATTTDTPVAMEMASRAAYTVAYGSTYLSPCVCHGLAGSIDLLLTHYQATGNVTSWNRACHLWTLLDDFRVPHAGVITWMNHHLQADDPALMTGYGGVVLCLLRLLDPKRPAFLTNHGIWYATPCMA